MPVWQDESRKIHSAGLAAPAARKCYAHFLKPQAPSVCLRHYNIAGEHESRNVPILFLLTITVNSGADTHTVRAKPGG
jgi:hypothetical protein